MPLLLSVAVFWRSANPQLWRVLSYVQYNAKNHIFSQMEKLGTLFFFSIHSNPPYSRVYAAKSDLDL